MFYRVRLTQDDNGTVMASFPEVPGALSYGESPQDALARAQDALLTVFDALMRDRRELPPPATPDGRPGVTLPVLEASKIAVYQAMRDQRVSKSELGRRLHVHLPQVDRLLNVRHASQVGLVDIALRALGKHLRVVVEDAPTLPVVRARTPTTRRAGAKATAAIRARSGGPRSAAKKR